MGSCDIEVHLNHPRINSRQFSSPLQQLAPPFFLDNVKQGKVSRWSTYPEQWSTLHCRWVLYRLWLSSRDAQFGGHIVQSSHSLTWLIEMYCTLLFFSFQRWLFCPLITVDLFLSKFTFEGCMTFCCCLACILLTVNMCGSKSHVFASWQAALCSFTADQAALIQRGEKKALMAMVVHNLRHPQLVFPRWINISVNFSVSAAYFMCPVIAAGCNIRNLLIHQRLERRESFLAIKLHFPLRQRLHDQICIVCTVQLPPA